MIARSALSIHRSLIVLGRKGRHSQALSKHSSSKPLVLLPPIALEAYGGEGGKASEEEDYQ